MDRRDFLLGTAVGGVIGVVGGATVLEEFVQPIFGTEDTDGDGVIDSEDYAPLDPEVQAKSDLRATRSTDTTDESTEARVIEDFEDGDVSEWTHNQDGEASFEATTEQSIQGDYSGYLSTTGDGSFPGYRLSLESSPVSISYNIYFKSTVSNNYPDLYPALITQGNDIIRLHFDPGHDNVIEIQTTNAGVEEGDTRQAEIEPEYKRWYHIAYRDIDYEQGIFDWYVDDELVASEVEFYTSASQFDEFAYEQSTYGGGESYIDHIKMT